MTLADTEYSQSLPYGMTKLLVQCRDNVDVKIGFGSSQSGTTYMLLKAGSVYYEDMLDQGVRTLYFQCAEAGKVLEILAWVK